MEGLTYVFAKAFGLYFLAVGLGISARPERFQLFMEGLSKKEGSNNGILLIGAVVALLVGVFTISLHNIWAMGFPIVITLIGWFSFIKGVLILILDDFTGLFINMIGKSGVRAIGATYFVLGLLIAYMGFSV